MITAFHEPESCAEAVRLKRELGENAVFLAGGTEVNSNRFPLNPEHLISLQRLDLATVERKDGELVAGALCTIQQLMDADDTPAGLRQACGNLINRNIRNVATIGGHVGCNLTESDILPALVALGTTVAITRVADGTEEAVQLADLLQADLSSLLITSVSIPVDNDRNLAVTNFTLSANDRSVVSVAVSLSVAQGRISRPIVAVGGVANHAVRLHDVEERLDQAVLPDRETLEKWGQSAVSPPSDFRGTSAFKSHLAGVLVAEATHEAAITDEGGVS